MLDRREGEPVPIGWRLTERLPRSKISFERPSADVEYGITHDLSVKGEWIWVGAGAGNTLKENILRLGLN